MNLRVIARPQAVRREPGNRACQGTRGSLSGKGNRQNSTHMCLLTEAQGPPNMLPVLPPKKIKQTDFFLHTHTIQGPYKHHRFAGYNVGWLHLKSISSLPLFSSWFYRPGAQKHQELLLCTPGKTSRLGEQHGRQILLGTAGF